MPLVVPDGAGTLDCLGAGVLGATNGFLGVGPEMLEVGLSTKEVSVVLHARETDVSKNGLVEKGDMYGMQGNEHKSSLPIKSFPLLLNRRHPGPCAHNPSLHVILALATTSSSLPLLLFLHPLEALRQRSLWEIHTKRIHIQPIQKAGKILAEPGQAFVHELEMHHVGFEVGHGVGQLGKGGLKGVERK